MLEKLLDWAISSEAPKHLVHGERSKTSKSIGDGIDYKYNRKSKQLMELKNIFYLTINLCNGKFYFGVHETNPEIFDGYIGNSIYRQSDANKKELKDSPFANAVKKYGYKNFKRTTIRIFPGTPEGRQAALDFEAAIVTEELLKSKNCYNVKTGGSGGAHIIGKRVYQFDKTGNFLRSYISAREAAINIPNVENIVSARSAIKNCCKGKTETAFGFVWSYTKEFKVVKTSKPIAQYTLYGKFIRSWNSAKEIEVELGYTHVIQCINDPKSVSYKGYQWRYYTGDDLDIDPLQDRFSNTRMMPVIMSDMDGKNTKEYDNIRECVAKNPELKLCVRSIVECCQGRFKSHKNHKFQFKQVEDIV